MSRHAKQLRDLHQSVEIELPGTITDYLDSKLVPVAEMAEKVAESAILKELPRYQKAKKLGEKFAREITS